MVENNPGQPPRADGPAWTSTEAAAGRAAPGHDPASAGDGISLAAATAAVITARWGASVATPERKRSVPSRADSGRSTSGHVDGHSSNGHSSNGHSSNGRSSDGQSSNGHSSTGYQGNGYSSNGHYGNGYPSGGTAANGYGSSGRESYDNGAAANGVSYFAPVETPATPAMFAPEPPAPAFAPFPPVPAPRAPGESYTPGESYPATESYGSSQGYPNQGYAPSESYAPNQGHAPSESYAPNQGYAPSESYAPSQPSGPGEPNGPGGPTPSQQEQATRADQWDPWAPAMPGSPAAPVSPGMGPVSPAISPVSPGMSPVSPGMTPAMPVSPAGFMSPDVSMSPMQSATAPVAPPVPPPAAGHAPAQAPAAGHAPVPQAPAPQAVPAAPAAETFDSIIGDLAFPEPFVPEPYEEYDPFHPKPSTPDSDLPQRVPGEPDVPDVQLAPNDPLRDPATVPVTESGDLGRIADFLQTLEPETARRDGFDVAAVLEAVRGVALVADAQLRFNAESGHTLRIEFVDGADEGEVTREVARLLRETMGLDAAPTQPLAPALAPARAVASVPTGRATVSGGVAPGQATIHAPAGPGHNPAPATLDHRSGRPLPAPTGAVPRVVLDHVQVTTLGLDATIEVQLTVSAGPQVVRQSVGHGHGPAVDAYLLRLAGSAAGNAIDQLLTIDGTSKARCYIEHVAVVPFAGCEVAVVVMLLVEGQLAEQLSGAAVVAGDPRQAVVRATLSAVNRRLESLLA